MTTTPVTTIPDHVPPDLVVDLDMYALPGKDDDPQMAWMSFAEADKGPVVWSPYNGGHWVATQSEDIISIYKDQANWSSYDISAPKHPGPRLIPLEADPPLHAGYRKSIMPTFAPKALTTLEPDARALAVAYIESFRSRGSCDFLGEFGLKFPITVYMGLMGMPPEDGPGLNDLLDSSVKSADLAHTMEVYGEIAAYIGKHVDDRLANPRDDGLTRITQGKHVDGQAFTHDEARMVAQMVTQGGLDSVAMHLSFIALHLATHDEHRRYVRDNLDTLDHVINEYARRYYIPNQMRTVPVDRTFHGVELKAGDLIAINPALYNFDEQLFPEPEEVRFDRPAHVNMTFGAGPHACPGANLTKLEVRIFLQEWLTRIPDFSVDPEVPVFKRSGQLHGINQLSLRWPVPTADEGASHR